MSVDKVRAAHRYFFEQVLTDRQRQELARSAAAVDARAGLYKAYDGGAFDCVGGVQVTPRFVIEAAAEALPLREGVPQAPSATPAGGSIKQALIWLRDVADIVHDGRAELERVLHNLDYLVGGDTRRNAAAWASAITGASDRAALSASFRSYREVPEVFRGLVDDVADLREVLYHFFTFTEAGEYYARYEGSGRRVPEDLSATFKQRNVLELQLAQYDAYIYGVVPVRFLDPRAPEPTGADREMREVVWGVRWGGADGLQPFAVRVVWTVQKTFTDTADFYDFVSFWAEDGVGVSMPASARTAVDGGLASFLLDLPTDAARRRAYLQHSPVTTDDDEPMVRVLASVDGSVTLPQGVRSAGDGPTRALLVPPDRVLEVAALQQVSSLQAPREVFTRLGDVEAMTNHAALTARIDAAKRGGKGVFIGIIDSGVDAQHPAFAGRIHSVWDHSNAAGPTPMANLASTTNPVNQAMRAFFSHGTELIGATVGNARDGGSHGTHVAGIAAGAAVTGTNPVPAGMAPEATIIAVRLGRAAPISTDPNVASSEVSPLFNFDVLTSLWYVMARAREANASAPVVINFSIGHHDHAHDGTDALSRAFDAAARTGGNPTPGLALVAAAGNERQDRMHVQRTVAAGATETLGIQFGRANARSLFTEVCTVWITSPSATATSLSASVRARRPAPATAATAAISQSATNTPTWQAFWGQGVHVGIVFGPKDPTNGDFNARVMFQTAAVLVPDAAGTVVVGGVTYRLDLLQRDWTVGTTGNHWSSVAGAFPLPLQSGLPWNVLVANTGTAALELHAWLGKENAAFSTYNAATDESHMILAPADAPAVLSVASCNSQLGTPAHPTGGAWDTNSEGALSSFSCPGPLRKQPANPGVDITAPGCMVTSARSAVHQASTSPADLATAVNTNAVAMAGTSMASPAVAGLLANILAEEPTLTIDHLRTRLEQCRIPTTLKDGTTPMPATAPTGVNDWGRGLIDADKLKAATP